MKYMLPIVFAATALSLQAKEVRLKDCPAGVKKAINSNLDGGVLDEIDRVVISGKTRYIVDIDGPGTRDVTFRFTPGGKVALKVEDITYQQAPRAVRNAIDNLLVSGSRIDDIDRVTQGNTVKFRVDIDRNNQTDMEYTISSSGKIVKTQVDND